MGFFESISNIIFTEVTSIVTKIYIYIQFHVCIEHTMQTFTGLDGKKGIWTCDFITGWPPQNISCNCGSDLHKDQEEFSPIPLYKCLSVQRYSCDVWCELLSYQCILIRMRSEFWPGHSRGPAFLSSSHSVVDSLIVLLHHPSSTSIVRQMA